jgi:hydroxypyruvate reductase
VPIATPSAQELVAEGHAREIYRAALVAVDPAPAVRHALGFATIPPDARLFLIALGKAAHPMARAAVELLVAQGIEPAAGLIVSHTLGDSPHPRIEAVVGDHPVAGSRSALASDRLEELVRQVSPRDVVWVMLSGGTSSLIGAAHSTLTAREYAELQEMLLASALPIGELNIVRKRVSRWGGGRLAQALEPARVRVLAISDVPDDDVRAIGSGPLAPDPASRADVKALLKAAGLWPRIPSAVRELLTRDDDALETPKQGDPAFRDVTTEIIASNRTAIDAAIDHARQLGYVTAHARTVLDGDAAAAGEALARELLAAVENSGIASTPLCLVSGGETVVELDGVSPNSKGGRAQELALSASRVLAGGDRGGRALVLLAAGTDGRDGPTDAAGAIVTPSTWRAISEAGRDPGRDLATHDAYRALDAAGALLRTGPTGTNVTDVAVLLAR